MKAWAKVAVAMLVGLGALSFISSHAKPAPEPKEIGYAFADNGDRMVLTTGECDQGTYQWFSGDMNELRFEKPNGDYVGTVCYALVGDVIRLRDADGKWIDVPFDDFKILLP